LDFVGIHERVRRDYPANFLKKISGGYDFHWDGIPARGDMEGFFWESIKGLMMLLINKWDSISLDSLLLPKKIISPGI
jgi:hypothetical protein